MVEEANGPDRLQEECHITDETPSEEINPGKKIGSLFSTPFPQVSALPHRSVEKVVEKRMVCVPPLSYTQNSSDSSDGLPTNVSRTLSSVTGGFLMSMSMPRSALRHRPIGPADIQEWVITPPQRQTAPHHTATDLPSLARRIHPLVLIGLSMLITLFLLWVIGGILAWGTLQFDTLRYGSPRTTQVEYAVGHGSQPSHFTAWNLQGHIYVLEIPASNPSASHLLVGPHLIGADLAPVHLRFVGDPHHPDLLVQVQDLVIPFHNTGTTYTPTTP